MRIKSHENINASQENNQIQVMQDSIISQTSSRNIQDFADSHDLQVSNKSHNLQDSIESIDSKNDRNANKFIESGITQDFDKSGFLKVSKDSRESKDFKDSKKSIESKESIDFAKSKMTIDSTESTDDNINIRTNQKSVSSKQTNHAKHKRKSLYALCLQKLKWRRTQVKIRLRYQQIKQYYYDFTDRGKIFHYASSLSFYNIFSIIPLFLMLFSIVASFPSFQGQIQNLKDTILANILPDSTNEVSAMLDRFLSNGKEMGFLGFLVSLISSFVFFRNFDDISARIFSAQKRSFFDSFIIYWLLITLIPLFGVTSLYFNNAILDRYTDILLKIYLATPFITIWFVFIMLFRIAANKQLRLSVLLFSSFVGAGTWHLLKSAFFYYMSYNQFYSNIYGSVSIVMFVFLWIYVSWLVVLISMRLCKKLDDRFQVKKS